MKELKNIPTKIYLQANIEADYNFDDWDELTEITWCKDKVEKTDIAYLREKDVIDFLKWIRHNCDVYIEEDNFYWQTMFETHVNKLIKDKKLLKYWLNNVNKK